MKENFLDGGIMFFFFGNVLDEGKLFARQTKNTKNNKSKFENIIFIFL